MATPQCPWQHWTATGCWMWIHSVFPSSSKYLRMNLKFVSFQGQTIVRFQRSFITELWHNNPDKNERLGEGEFAFCYRGKCNGVTVAVKMLKNSVQTEDFKNYLKEVKLMAYIGQHPNIIQFYGAVIEKLDQSKTPSMNNFVALVGLHWMFCTPCRDCTDRCGTESVWSVAKILARAPQECDIG